jgi:hypothetical protein
MKWGGGDWETKRRKDEETKRRRDSLVIKGFFRYTASFERLAFKEIEL